MDYITRPFLLIALSIWIAAPAASSHPTVPPKSCNDLVPGFCKSPSTLDDYPVVNGETVIDPWSYLERLGLYKIMLNVTDKYMPPRNRTLTSKSHTWNLDNVLWGLPIQFGWQMRSGRLQDFSQFPSNISERVSPNSWWGSLNYYLSVIPFLGALNSGVINHKYPIKLLPPKYHAEDFCLTIESCKEFGEAVQHWTEFFEGVVTNQSGFVAIPTLTPRKETILDLIWTAHRSSLHMVLDRFSGEVLSLMPPPEQKIGLSWANLVDYIAAVR